MQETSSKFKNCPRYTQHFWNMALGGYADEDDCGVYKFHITSKDIANFPELRLGDELRLREVDGVVVLETGVRNQNAQYELNAIEQGHIVTMRKIARKLFSEDNKWDPGQMLDYGKALHAICDFAEGMSLETLIEDANNHVEKVCEMVESNNESLRHNIATLESLKAIEDAYTARFNEAVDSCNAALGKLNKKLDVLIGERK